MVLFNALMEATNSFVNNAELLFRARMEMEAGCASGAAFCAMANRYVQQISTSRHFIAKTLVWHPNTIAANRPFVFRNVGCATATFNARKETTNSTAPFLPSAITTLSTARLISVASDFGQCAMAFENAATALMSLNVHALNALETAQRFAQLRLVDAFYAEKFAMANRIVQTAKTKSTVARSQSFLS